MPEKINLDTTSNTYVLFMDMLEVEALHNVELVVNQAEKHLRNPVLPTGDLNDFDISELEDHQPSATGYDGKASMEEALAVIKSYEI